MLGPLGARLTAQLSLLGEPALNAELSQLFTPMWLARKAVGWLPAGAAVIEPSFGSGNLIAAATEAGHRCVGCELDPAWVEYARNRFADRKIYSDRFGGALPLLTGNFLTMGSALRELVATHQITAGITNPPYENNLHMAFVLELLKVVPVVVGVFPVAFRFSQERDSQLWARYGRVTHCALLPERVDFGGDTSGKFDAVVLRIERRQMFRPVGEQNAVIEEVWTKEAA